MPRCIVWPVVYGGALETLKAEVIKKKKERTNKNKVFLGSVTVISALRWFSVVVVVNLESVS